jgi:hypothetical protein
MDRMPFIAFILPGTVPNVRCRCACLRDLAVNRLTRTIGTV